MSPGAGVYRLVTDRSDPCTFEAGQAAIGKQESFQRHGAEKAGRKTFAVRRKETEGSVWVGQEKVIAYKKRNGWKKHDLSLESGRICRLS